MTGENKESKRNPADEARVQVAVDAAGGDVGASVMVPGVVDALRRDASIDVVLYGARQEIDRELDDLEAGDLPIEIVPCTQRIEMGESPATAIRSKPDSPITRAMRDHREGRVSAVVSAGSTGAMVAGSLMILGRLPAVDRPAITTVIPTLQSRYVLLDVGANVQNTARHLLTFGSMGSLYSKAILEVASPRVGLLNIGEESSKGTELLQEAYVLFKESGRNFVGNVESKQIMFDVADVVVTDGFTGNIVLKLVESFGGLLGDIAREWLAHEKTDGSGGSGALGGLLGRMDYAAYGGALLQGVKGTPIICHGASSPRAITNAVLTAKKLIEFDMPAKLQAELAGTD